MSTLLGVSPVEMIKENKRDTDNFHNDVYANVTNFWWK